MWTTKFGNTYSYLIPILLNKTEKLLREGGLNANKLHMKLSALQSLILSFFALVYRKHLSLVKSSLMVKCHR